MSDILFDLSSEEREEAKRGGVSFFHDDVNNEEMDALELQEIDYEPLDTPEARAYNELFIKGNKTSEEPKTISQEVQKRRIARYIGDSTKMLQRMAIRSGHQSGYDGAPVCDKVDELRANQKKATMERLTAQNQLLEKKGIIWPDSWKDATAKQIQKPCSSAVKAIAKELGVDPTTLSYPAHMRSLSNKALRSLIKKCKEGNNALAVWNYWSFRLKPKFAWLVRNKDGKAINGKVVGYARTEPVRTTSTLPYIAPGTEVQTYLTGQHDSGTINDREDVMAQTEMFMLQAEMGFPVADKITKCRISGESLVSIKSTGLKFWCIAPNLWGLSLNTAKLAVAAAAIKIGLADGHYTEIPELDATIDQLADDQETWAIFAVITGQRQMIEKAKIMLMSNYFLSYGMTEDEADKAIKNLENVASHYRMLYPRKPKEDGNAAQI